MLTNLYNFNCQTLKFDYLPLTKNAFTTVWFWTRELIHIWLCDITTITVHFRYSAIIFLGTLSSMHHSHNCSLPVFSYQLPGNSFINVSQPYCSLPEFSYQLPGKSFINVSQPYCSLPVFGYQLPGNSFINVSQPYCSLPVFSYQLPGNSFINAYNVFSCIFF